MPLARAINEVLKLIGKKVKGKERTIRILRSYYNIQTLFVRCAACIQSFPHHDSAMSVIMSCIVEKLILYVN